MLLFGLDVLLSEPVLLSGLDVEPLPESVLLSGLDVELLSEPVLLSGLDVEPLLEPVLLSGLDPVPLLLVSGTDGLFVQFEFILNLYFFPLIHK